MVLRFCYRVGEPSLILTDPFYAHFIDNPFTNVFCQRFVNAHFMLHCAEKRTFAKSIIYTLIMKHNSDERSLRQHPVKDNEVKAEQQNTDGTEHLHSSILTQFHQAAAQVRRMPDSSWAELRQVVNREMPGFMAKLSAFAYSPDMTETQIIILLRLRFLLSEIAALLNISPSLLAMKRRRLLKKLFDMDGSPNLFDERIKQL